jgi:Flp pilus assembly protein TadG
MSIYRRIAKSLKSFASNQTGVTSTLFAVSAIPLFITAGAAIDYSRYTYAQMEVATALDVAVLAGAAARNVSDAQRINIAQTAYDKNLDDGMMSKTEFKPRKGFMSAKAEVEVPTSFMKIVGIDTMHIKVENEVNLLGNKKAEIALVLDYSGSMDTVVRGEKKYVSMQRAANKLVDDLSKLEKDKFKVGLVPFSHHVYVTLPKQYVAGQTGSGNWTGCTVDRKGPFNTTNALPNAGDDTTKWGQKQANIWPGNPKLVADQLRNDCDGPNGNDGYAANKLVVRPLSTDFAAVKSQLSAMEPYAYTHIALGMEFGYQMLSPDNAFGTKVAEFKDKDVEKYLVLLTDGSQTAAAFNDTTNLLGDTSAEQGEKNLVRLCQAAKKNGVKVITLAFDLTDKDASKAEDTKARLKSCASETSLYFDAKDGSDIADAFKSITQEIAQNIFLSK